MKPLVFPFYAEKSFSEAFAHQIDGDLASFNQHRFPDGESYLRVNAECTDRLAYILADLHDPDAKLLPLIFLCNTLREENISKITLVTPYLPYMRQDKKFHPGEAVTSRHFAKLLSPHIDLLITVDPHLHRYHSLDEIYTVPSQVLHATHAIASWIKSHVDKPIVVGPDSESEQWAAETANMIDCPYLVLHKDRFGDRDVRITAPGSERYRDHTPVLIDDIISTGHTMMETARALVQEGLSGPICVGVHALFSDNAWQEMQQSEISRIITCNTVAHESNGIDIVPLLADTAVSQK